MADKLLHFRAASARNAARVARLGGSRYLGLVRRLTAWLAILTAVSSVAQGQCTDGSQPPCAQPRAVIASNSVAVLYFDNVTRDSTDAYLADGLTESIIVRLGALERLQVKSRGAVRPLRNQPAQDPAVVGTRLRVAYLVTGSVRRAARRLRVTVELVRSTNGVQVWAQQFDRPDDDVLTVEQEIAAAVAAAIAGRLLPAESAVLAARPTRVPAAYNQFLRGHYYLAQRSTDGTARALSAYEAAVRADPAFTAALARTAYAYGLAVSWEYDVLGLPMDSLLQRGFSAVNRALRTDSSSADAWLALGLLRAYDQTSNWRQALAAFDRGVAQDPRSAEAHHSRGWYLFVLSHDSLARDEWRRALALEPERPISLWHLARAAYVARRFQECIALSDSAIALDRGFGPGYAIRAYCLATSGVIDRARADAAEALRLSIGGGGESEAWAVVAAAFVDLRAGDTAAVRRRLAERIASTSQAAGRTAWSAYAIGGMHALLGERELAVAALDRLRQRAGYSPTLRQPEFDSMRDYPPFARLVEDLNVGRR